MEVKEFLPKEAYEYLEREFGSWAGVKGVVACASGTAALHLALESLCLPPGSGVIVPEFTMIACARAVTLAGLKPVFVDCGKDLLIDLDCVDHAASAYSWVRAVMPVHIYGRRCAMEGLAMLADKYSLYVIEDLAEAHGLRVHPRTDAACWSFYRNKIVAGEEGGAVAFPYRDDREKRFRLAKQLRSLGFTAEHDFYHVPRGHNYRMSNSHAQLIRQSLEQVMVNISNRREIEGLYDRACPNTWKQPPRDVPWVYDVRIPSLTDRQKFSLIKGLNANGVAARHSFKPMSYQPEYKIAHSPTDTRYRLPWAAALASSEVFYLPIVPGETNVGSIEKSFELIYRELKCLGYST